MTWDGKVPTRNGSLLNYVGYWNRDDIVWVDGRKPFRARMRFDGFYRGRSAAGGILVDQHGREFTIFLLTLSP